MTPTPEPTPTPAPAPPATPSPELTPRETVLTEAAPPAPPAEPPKAPEPPPSAEFDIAKLTLPEGFSLTPELQTEFGEIAKTNKLSVESAQKFVDLHSRLVSSAIASAASQMADQVRQWGETVKADPELGGANLPNVQRTVAKALEQYGAPGIKEALSETGVGNHPAIVRTLFNLSKAVTEGGFVNGAPASKAAPKSAADIFYPQSKEA